MLVAVSGEQGSRRGAHDDKVLQLRQADANTLGVVRGLREAEVGDDAADSCPKMPPTADDKRPRLGLHNLSPLWVVQLPTDRLDACETSVSSLGALGDGQQPRYWPRGWGVHGFASSGASLMGLLLAHHQALAGAAQATAGRLDAPALSLAEAGLSAGVVEQGATSQGAVDDRSSGLRGEAGAGQGATGSGVEVWWPSEEAERRDDGERQGGDAGGTRPQGDVQALGERGVGSEEQVVRVTMSVTVYGCSNDGTGAYACEAGVPAGACGAILNPGEVGPGVTAPSLYVAAGPSWPCWTEFLLDTGQRVIVADRGGLVGDTHLDAWCFDASQRETCLPGIGATVEVIGVWLP